MTIATEKARNELRTIVRYVVGQLYATEGKLPLVQARNLFMKEKRNTLDLYRDSMQRHGGYDEAARHGIRDNFLKKYQSVLAEVLLARENEKPVVYLNLRQTIIGKYPRVHPFSNR